MLMRVDVKLNLQETDYGNFLSEEVLRYLAFPSWLATSSAPKHLPSLRSEKAGQRVDVHARSGHAAPRSDDGFHFVTHILRNHA